MKELSPIEQYLEDLRGRLEGMPGRESILWEVEDHLNESALRFQREGLSGTESEGQATLRFGAVDLVAARFANAIDGEEMMGSSEKVGGVKLLAVVFALVAVAQLLAIGQVALRVENLGWLVTLAVPAIHVMLAIGLWRLRKWSRTGVLVWAGAMMMWGVFLALVGWIATSDASIFGHRVPPAAIVFSGMVTIGTAAAVVHYMRRPEIRLTLGAK